MLPGNVSEQLHDGRYQGLIVFMMVPVYLSCVHAPNIIIKKIAIRRAAGSDLFHSQKKREGVPAPVLSQVAGVRRCSVRLQNKRPPS